MQMSRTAGQRRGRGRPGRVAGASGAEIESGRPPVGTGCGGIREAVSFMSRLTKKGLHRVLKKWGQAPRGQQSSRHQGCIARCQSPFFQSLKCVLTHYGLKTKFIAREAPKPW